MMKRSELEMWYDAEVAPLMERVIALCQAADLPFTAVFGDMGTGGNVLHAHMGHVPANLPDERVKHVVACIVGIQTVLGDADTVPVSLTPTAAWVPCPDVD